MATPSLRDPSSSPCELERLQTSPPQRRGCCVPAVYGQASHLRSNVDFVWPASRPRLNFGWRRGGGQCRRQGHAPLHAGVLEWHITPPCETRMSGSSSRAGGVSSALRRCVLTSGYAHPRGDSWAYAHPPFFPLAEFLMRTSHRGSPSFVSPRKPPVKEEWIEQQNMGRLSVVTRMHTAGLHMLCYVMLMV